jgi:nitrite reductase/ring-hydroxylating ferredoxin subunit
VNGTNSPRVRVAAGAEATLGAGQVRPVPLPRGVGGIPREALVVRDQSGVVRAYLNRCRHLPVPIDGGSRRFLSRDRQHLECGTHGARYRLEDGHCVAGPCAGSGLLAIPLELDAGTIYLLIER